MSDIEQIIAEIKSDLEKTPDGLWYYTEADEMRAILEYIDDVKATYTMWAGECERIEAEKDREIKELKDWAYPEIESLKKSLDAMVSRGLNSDDSALLTEIQRLQNKIDYMGTELTRLLPDIMQQMEGKIKELWKGLPDGK